MLDPIPDQQTRLGENAKKRIDELERVVKALIKAIQNAEKETGEPLMPEGEFYGQKFED